MALVAYEYSDSEAEEISDEEDDENVNKVSVVELLPREPEVNSIGGLFSALPKPKAAVVPIVEEDVDILIRSKLNEESASKKLTKVKISIPALSSYLSDEEDAPPKKVVKKQVKASGLFAILPDPKRALPERSDKFDAKVAQKNNFVPRTIKAATEKAKKRQAESDDEEIEEGRNFFSSIFTDNRNLPVTPIVSSSLNIQIDSAKPVHEKSNTYFANLVAEAQKKPELVPEIGDDEETEEDLDKKAIKELCGKKSKRMKKGDIQFIDINAQDVMPDPLLWKTKALTEEAPQAACKKGEEPSTQSKRKHQITYLAYQAKMNEQELKNQWALNRMTKKQTQAKYGF